MKAFAWGLLACLCCYSGVAQAALTQSEKQQVIGYVRSGEAARAERVRALIARPDLSQEESAEPLIAGYQRVPFGPERARFTQELLFGPGSAPARGVLAEAVVSALLARADAIVGGLSAQDNPAVSPAASRVAAELVSLHGFVSEHIGNAGSPPEDGHDASMNIRDDVLERCTRRYAEHFERHGSWLRLDRSITPAWMRARAQAAVTLTSLARGVVPRHEVSAMLGLDATRRGAFERHGFLLDDGGVAADERRRFLLRLLDGAPHAAGGLKLLSLGKSPVLGLVTAGDVARASADARAGARVKGLFAEDVEAPEVDAAVAELAYVVAWRATRAAFRRTPELRQLALANLERVRLAGEAGFLSRDLPAMVLATPDARQSALGGLSPEQLVAHAVRLVLLDAERTATLALSRAIRGRDEPLSTLVVALSVLAGHSSDVKELMVGKLASDGVPSVVALPVTTEAGRVTAFGAGNARTQVSLAADGRVERVQLAGKPPVLSKLPFARLMPEAAEAWSGGGLRFEKLFGAPRALVLDDGRFLLAAAEGATGFDAVATGEARADLSVSAKLTVEGAGGGLLVRAASGPTSYDGIALLITGSPRQAWLVAVDGKGKAVELVPARDLGERESYSVTLGVTGSKVTAKVDRETFVATLTQAATPGRVGITARAGGRVVVKEFTANTVKVKKGAR